jgi:hypothetical protein
MKIRIFGNVLVNGVWHETGIGNYDPALAEHLIDIGVAEKYETKVIEDFQTKEVVEEKKPFTASQPAPASRKRTAKNSGKKPAL